MADSSPAAGRSHVTILESSWGVISILPEENQEEIKAVLDSFQEGNSTATKQKEPRHLQSFPRESPDQVRPGRSPLPWIENSIRDRQAIPGASGTGSFLIPAESAPIEIRGILVKEILALFAPGFQPVAHVTTANSPRKSGRKCQNCFAMERADGPVLYGTQEQGVVTSLNFLDLGKGDGTWVDLLRTLAVRHRLILVDWSRRTLVNLQDSQGLRDYLTRLEEELAREGDNETEDDIPWDLPNIELSPLQSKAFLNMTLRWFALALILVVGFLFFLLFLQGLSH